MVMTPETLAELLADQVLNVTVDDLPRDSDLDQVCIGDPYWNFPSHEHLINVAARLIDMFYEEYRGLPTLEEYKP